jgi:hypothetical protein
MGEFDGTVNKIINDISAVRNERQNEARALSTAAENKFGNVGQLIRELQPALASKFSDEEPSIELGDWVKTKNGATNKLKLKRKGQARERNIELEMEHGKPEVIIINKKSVPARRSQWSRQKLSVFSARNNPRPSRGRPCARSAGRGRVRREGAPTGFLRARRRSRLCRSIVTRARGRHCVLVRVHAT